MKQTPQEHPPEAQKAAEKGSAQHSVRADLKAYLDGELSSLPRWLTARHVERCASCRDEMRRLEHLGRQVQHLDQALPGSHLRARILASLPAAPPVPAPAASRFRPVDARSLAALSRRPLGAAMGLCALLLMVGAFALARYGRAGAAGGGNPAPAVAQGVATGPSATHNTLMVASSVASSSNVQRSALSPFQPQPDPFAPDTTTQVEGKAGAGADTGAAQHSTPTGADGTNNEGASQTEASPQTAYTDPTSAAADRIAATILPDRLREKRQAAGAVQASASIHPSIPSVKMAATVPMQMSVAVADVSEASRQVRKWAEQAGAQVTLMPSKTIKTAAALQSPDGASDAVRSAYDAHTATGGGSAAPAPALPAPQTAAIMRLRVPVQRAAGFEAYLSHMGKSAGAAAHTKSEEINAVHDLKADAVVTRPYPMPARVFEAEPAAPSKQTAMVTILVRLQPENPAPRP